MPISLNEFLSLDLPALLAALFAALSCALLGNFLVLRKLSLMGDAISHAVLPGIVIAFLLSSSRASLAVFLGAAGAGIAAAVLIELVRRFGRLEEGASMGVIFSIFFALGVLLIEQAAARSVDLDAECLLHGQLETIFWYPPAQLSDWFTLRIFSLIPPEVLSSTFVFSLSLIFVIFLYKELKLSCFDPALGTALGFKAHWLHFLLIVFIAAAVVVSFEAVGSILVIAMLICPAATARLITDRLKTQIVLSQIVSLIAVVSGYFGGAFGPFVFGFSNSVNAAGMMTVMLGLLLLSAVLLSPRYGVIPRKLRQSRYAEKVLLDDIVGVLYRVYEHGALNGEPLVNRREIANILRLDKISPSIISKLVAKGLIEKANGDSLKLTVLGKTRGAEVVRAHRLWESFLVKWLGQRPDHVHERATELEHITSSQMVTDLANTADNPAKDPHGKPIP